MAMYFMGVKRSSGNRKDEKGKDMVWDNAVIFRCCDLEPKQDERAEDMSGYQTMAECKIRMSDFQAVTGETYVQFLAKAEERFMSPMVVMFGEMRGTSENKRADVQLLRFAKPDGTIDL